MNYNRAAGNETFIGRDLVTRAERMALKPYGEYHDRRAYRSIIVGGAALALTALAESRGLNSELVRAAAEAVGAFTIPLIAGAAAGAGYYILRRDLPAPAGRYGTIRAGF